MCRRSSGARSRSPIILRLWIEVESVFGGCDYWERCLMKLAVRLLLNQARARWTERRSRVFTI